MEQYHLEDYIKVPVTGGYYVHVSNTIEDPDWDAFLVKTPGGHHVQTSLWTQVKAILGWRAVRIIVTQWGGKIVAGVQLLMRPLPMFGNVGYATKGPVIVQDDPLLIDIVFNQLRQVIKTHRIYYLVLQPPSNGNALAQQLSQWGFQLSPFLGTSASVVIDLTKDIDDLMHQMDSKTRYNLRLGIRKGIKVREGTERDLDTFYHLLHATSQRKKFPIASMEYFKKMWRVFSPRGYIKLFLAEYEGEIISAQLAISFGDTVINKLTAWSGRYGTHRPNVVLNWSVIEWARAHGYHYYDFDGIDPTIARTILQGEPLPKESLASFKVGFGGQIALFPKAYNYIHNPAIRRIWSVISPMIANRPLTIKITKYLRTR